MKVKYVAEHNGLVVMPTDVPFVIPGLPFVEIGNSSPILVPILDKPGQYVDKRLTGCGPGRTWWISAHTVDPDHLLIAWDGKSYIGGSSAIQLVSH